jgi:protein-L-isoaspartate O-methyltransferase
MTSALAQSASLEYAVKATFLYKFAAFVDWPADAFASPTSPINLCVALYDPFGSLLDQAAAGQRVGERPIVVRRLTTIDPRSGCHILYIGAGAGVEAVAEALAVVHGTPVLTVTDSERDPRATGVINFLIENNRVRFEIDDGAAAANGLTISSKLLSLAVFVKPRG